MIPQRIALSGFLSYQAEQEIDFEGSPLWMLGGPNGSGKSSIFDGITFSLFGHHRGGSQQVQELINNSSNGLGVEFDFAIDKEVYRIRRTVKRTQRGSPSSTQQIYQRSLDPQTNAVSWVPIPDTNRRAEFDAWIREKIGLNFETFTSSVLLLQGKSEKLLDAAPRGRAEVLASIVDLERYKRLHEKADTERKTLKDNLKLLNTQIEVIPEIAEKQLREADARLQEAEQQRWTARTEAERCQQLEFEVRKWDELQSRLAKLRDQWKQANVLLGDAAKIEADFQRLRELRDVLPHINAIQQSRNEIELSEGRTKKHIADQQQIQARRDERNQAIELARKKRTSLQGQQTQDEQRRAQVEARLRELSTVLERVRLVEAKQAQLVEVENQLQRLPSDGRKAVTDLQGLLERCQQKAAALPLMERFDASRAELRQHKDKLSADKKREKTLRKEGEDAKKQAETATAEHEAAVKARAAADASATEAKTLLQQAKADLKEISKLEGKKACNYCGQTLTAKGIKDEKAKREKELRDAEKADRDAAKAQDEAKKEEARAQEAMKMAEATVNSLRDKYREITREMEQANRDMERCANDCLKAYDSLPAIEQKRIAKNNSADWLETTFPEATDLAALRKEAGEADMHRKKLREAEEACRVWERLKNQADSSRQSIERLKKELPAGDPASIRADHASIQAEEASLRSRLAGATKSLAENQNEVDRLVKDLQQVEKQHSDLESNLRAEEVRRQGGEEAIDRAYKLLPVSWQERARKAGIAELHQWNVDLKELEAKDTATKHQQLGQARMGLDSFKQGIADAEAEESRFPEEARKPLTEAQARLVEAKRAEVELEKGVRAAEQQKGLLEQQRKRREDLHAAILAMDREHTLAETLAELLGRDRLQRHLVRVAERQIVDYANAVLDRLSAGQLSLRLYGSEEGIAAERALELEACNRATGEEPINVAFLSGSQRFRVAVSLALGIGQYASRQHRPIESVIIDEGFGCLDREGRQVMIQELQNLRGQLRRILLVSHQEEFADAFPDGYRFELQDGATQVRRFQR